MSDYYDELIRRNDIVAVAQELGLAMRMIGAAVSGPKRMPTATRAPLSFNLGATPSAGCPDVGGSDRPGDAGRGVSREGRGLPGRAPGMPPPEAAAGGTVAALPYACAEIEPPEATPGTRGPRVPMVRRTRTHTLVAPDRPPPREPQLEPEQIARIYSASSSGATGSVK